MLEEQKSKKSNLITIIPCDYIDGSMFTVNCEAKRERLHANDCTVWTVRQSAPFVARAARSGGSELQIRKDLEVADNS